MTYKLFDSFSHFSSMPTIFSAFCNFHSFVDFTLGLKPMVLRFFRWPPFFTVGDNEFFGGVVCFKLGQNDIFENS